MQLKTPAIVLNQFRYSDSSFIAHVLTEKHGRLPLLVHSGKSRKSGGKHVYFQPLYLLELDVDYKENRDIQHVRELKPIEVLHNISTDIRKQSIALFLAEVLQRSIRSGQVDDALFYFVYHSVGMFEHMKEGSNLFHHYFLAQLMKFLGFAPGNSYSETYRLLDTEAGLFVGYGKLNPVCLNETESRMIQFFLDIKAEELPGVKLSKEKKNNLLESILLYYSKHIPGFDSLSSYQILKDVFA